MQDLHDALKPCPHNVYKTLIRSISFFGPRTKTEIASGFYPTSLAVRAWCYLAPPPCNQAT